MAAAAETPPVGAAMSSASARVVADVAIATLPAKVVTQSAAEAVAADAAAAAPVPECRNDRRWYLGERLIGRVQGPFFKSSFKVGQV